MHKQFRTFGYCYRDFIKVSEADSDFYFIRILGPIGNDVLLRDKRLRKIECNLVRKISLPPEEAYGRWGLWRHCEVPM
jgi:hypothetical protein